MPTSTLNALVLALCSVFVMFLTCVILYYAFAAVIFAAADAPVDLFCADSLHGGEFGLPIYFFPTDVCVGIFVTDSNVVSFLPSLGSYRM